MGRSLGWARVWPAVKRVKAPTLRRGAWYPVTQDASPSWVKIDVDGDPITVPRHLLEIRYDRPRRFSVVHRRDPDLAVPRGTSPDLGPRYAVCPVSKSRVRLLGHPDNLECPDCGYRGPIAWWETV